MQTWQGWAGPLQYGPAGRCQCGATLSCYNPHDMCGPCRRSAMLAGLVGGFRRRKPLGRGPLLPETDKT